MTNRQRMTALMQGRQHDTTPFVQYDGIVPNAQAWEIVGRRWLGLARWTSAHRSESPNCWFADEPLVRNGRPGTRRTLKTPEGVLSQVRLTEPVYGSSAALEHFVKEPEDYRVLLAYLRDLRVYADPDAFWRSWNELGEDGLPHVNVGRTPYQQLWVQWVNAADLAWHLSEGNELLSEVIAEMERVQTDVFGAVCQVARETPMAYVNFGDNITAPMVGERYFRQYCVPAYQELAGMLVETGRDVPVQVHMDGDLKPLWAAIAESGVRSLDSMSPPPDNDTSVADAIRQWPEMRVCINFPSSVHLLAPDQVYQAAMGILEEGGRQGRLQIQISENVPPGVWRSSYPAIAAAVRDFGPACA